MDNWSIKDEKGNFVDATVDNIIDNYLSNPYQKPKTKKEEKEIEKTYLDQLNIRVKCYHDGHNNIIEFL